MHHLLKTKQGDSQPGLSSLRIGEIARRSGLGIETLRFYERAGLLDRPERTSSGYRVYTESVLDRLHFIKQAQLLGFTLDEIRILIEHKKQGESPCKEVQEMVREKLEELEERILLLNQHKQELERSLSEWAGIGEREGHVCGLIENAQVSAATRARNKNHARK